METVVGIGYLSTMPGILKALQLLFDFIGLICIVAVGLSAAGTAFLIGAVFALIWTAILLFFYVVNVISKLHLPWFGLELIVAAVLTLYFIIVSSICIANLSVGYIAGGVFGLLAAISYAADAFHKYSNM